MHLVRFTDGIPYEPTAHVGVHPRRIQGREAGGPARLAVSHSHYPPGSGSAELIPSPGELVYVVVAGVVEVEHDGGIERLERGDSISFSAGERRAARNPGDEDAELIVIHEETTL